MRILFAKESYKVKAYLDFSNDSIIFLISLMKMWYVATDLHTWHTNVHYNTDFIKMRIKKRQN